MIVSISRRKGWSSAGDEVRCSLLLTEAVPGCPGIDTRVYVGHVPGFPGAHSQGATLDELHANLREVIAMLLEDGA